MSKPVFSVLFLSFISLNAFASEKINFQTSAKLSNQLTEIQATLEKLDSPEITILGMENVKVYPAGCDEYDCSPIGTVCRILIDVSFGNLSLNLPSKMIQSNAEVRTVLTHEMPQNANCSTSNLPSKISLKDVTFESIRPFSDEMITLRTKNTIDLIFMEKLNLVDSLNLIRDPAASDRLKVESIQFTKLNELTVEVNRSVYEKNAFLPYPEKDFKFLGREKLKLPIH